MNDVLNYTHNQSTDTTGYVPPEIVSFRYFGISVAVFTIVVGSIGNALTILAFFSNKKLQTVFNTFVVNLSFVDFITSSLMLPFNLAGYVQMEWPFGNTSFTSRIQAFSYFSCGYTSVVFLVAITMNRLVGVLFPRKYKTTFSRKSTIFILLSCWTFAPLCLLPFLIGTDPSCPNQALTGFNQNQLLCTFLCLPPLWFDYMQVTRIIFQFLPLGIMILVYTVIFFILRNKWNVVAKNLTTTPLNDCNSTPGTSTAGRRVSAVPYADTVHPPTKLKESRQAQNTKRLLVVSVTVCATFMVTFLPSVIINLFPNRSMFDTRWHMAASNMSWFNGALNPIIYAILNPNFQKEYIRLVKKLIGKISNSSQSKTYSSSNPNKN